MVIISTDNRGEQGTSERIKGLYAVRLGAQKEFSATSESDAHVISLDDLIGRDVRG
jgi:hypothetical protein